MNSDDQTQSPGNSEPAGNTAPTPGADPNGGANPSQVTANPEVEQPQAPVEQEAPARPKPGVGGVEVGAQVPLDVINRLTPRGPAKRPTRNAKVSQPPQKPIRPVANPPA